MAEGMKKYAKEILDANIRKAKEQSESKKIQIPLDRLTIRGQSGESILRGQQSKKSK
jgi:hypothetical protein